MTRLVLDASILLSAVLEKPGSNTSSLLGAVRSGTIEMVACDQLLDEVRKGLAGRYFRNRIAEEQRLAVPAMLRTLAVMVPNPVSPPSVLRDPSDDYLVALATATAAVAIVTGDRDLLEHEGLKPPALSAREACRQLGLTEA